MLDLDFQLIKGNFELRVKERLEGTGFTVIQGRSGCGKTTLLRCIAGLEPRTTGRLKVAGVVWQDGKGAWLPTHKRSLGYVPQEPTLFPNRTVRANLEFGLKRTASTQRALSFDDVVAILELGPMLQRSPEKLSGGQQQRVAIARALLTSPSLLLMDEPLANLDDESKDTILPYLDHLAATLAIPVLYVTHSTQESARLANELLLMESGRVSRRGPASDLLTALDMDLSRQPGAYARLNGFIARHDDDFGLTWVQVAGQELALHRLPHLPGSAVALQVAARDVSIALSRADDSSIVNLVDSTIEGLAGDSDPAYCIIRLRVGREALLARISTYSAKRLKLGPGMSVVAQIKAISL